MACDNLAILEREFYLRVTRKLDW